MKKLHYALYATSFIWDVLICWPAVLLIRLFWGENLRWEQNPNPDKGDGKSLWCDLKGGSWPTRTWYAKYKSGNWLAFLTKEEPVKRQVTDPLELGPYRTWGGTTLGHGGFYGPGIAKADGWTRTQEHEHVHVEQFEASMVVSFLGAVYWSIITTFTGYPFLALVSGLLYWLSGGFMYGVAGWATAKLRGESPYRGSHHEEAAYKIGNDWQDVPQETETEG